MSKKGPDKKLVKFEAIKTVKQPTVVHFNTKDGETIKFKATKIVKEKQPIKFYAKDK
jgi:hypothetical protein